jgi:bifunctional DNA-binding transcriptional regulator/antitoxin component of YhaV-PrlF toxin-antitoxin module
MERRQIRKRWQITIPREIRQRLNFYVGQLLCFDVVEDSAESLPYVRIYMNIGAAREDELACKEATAKIRRLRRRQRCGRKIRNSDTRVKSLGKRIEMIRSPDVIDATEFREMITDMSGYLLTLQRRLSTSPETS